MLQQTSLSSTVAKSVQVPSNCVWLRWEMSRKRQAPGDSIGMSVWVMFGRFFPQVEPCRKPSTKFAFLMY